MAPAIVLKASLSIPDLTVAVLNMDTKDTKIPTVAIVKGFNAKNAATSPPIAPTRVPNLAAANPIKVIIFGLLAIMLLKYVVISV